MEPPEDAGKMGMSGKYLRKVGSGYKNGGEVICGSGASGDPVWFRDVGPDTPVGEGPHRFYPPVSTADGGHGP